MKALSIAGYLGMMGGLVALVVTGNLFSPALFPISVQVAGFLLVLWARIHFGRRSYHIMANPTEGGVVTNGPYRYIRHPLYAGMCLFTLGGVIGHWSWTSAGWAALVLLSAVVRIVCEEALVTARFPEYAKYAAKSWRLIPYLY